MSEEIQATEAKSIEVVPPEIIVSDDPPSKSLTSIATGEGEEERVVVFATSPQQMKAELARLELWAKKKYEYEKSELKDLQENLQIATKNHWRTKSIARHVTKQLRKVEFWEKFKLAVESGYYPVPDMPIDIFAVRTNRKHPKTNDIWTKWERNGPADQESNRPKAGEGRYVSTEAETKKAKSLQKDDQGNQYTQFHVWAHDFREVDFPFIMAKPQIATATAEAMKKKIFDEIGILPARRQHGDPMVVGRINLRMGAYSTKQLSFLLVWFIDTKDL